MYPHSFRSGFSKLTILGVLLSALFSPSLLACTPITSTGPITQPGKYCLSNALQASGSGIQIAISASNVELDLNGYSLTCPSSQNGIFLTASPQRNVHIKGGSIVGCNIAVNVGKCSGCSVTNMSLLNSGSAITTFGDGTRIEHNRIHHETNGGAAIGLNGSHAVVQSNSITGGPIGISQAGKNTILRDNSIATCSTGVLFIEPATYQNTLARCTTNFSGAALASSVNAGGNF
jgi:hypothetical protein